MEFIGGKTMREYIKGVGAPKLTQLPYVKQIGLQLLSAIKYLHSKYITHGYISPKCLMFDQYYKNIKIINLAIMTKLH